MQDEYIGRQADEEAGHTRMGGGAGPGRHDASLEVGRTCFKRGELRAITRWIAVFPLFSTLLALRTSFYRKLAPHHTTPRGTPTSTPSVPRRRHRTNRWVPPLPLPHPQTAYAIERLSISAESASRLGSALKWGSCTGGQALKNVAQTCPDGSGVATDGSCWKVGRGPVSLPWALSSVAVPVEPAASSPRHGPTPGRSVGESTLITAGGKGGRLLVRRVAARSTRSWRSRRTWRGC